MLASSVLGCPPMSVDTGSVRSVPVAAFAHQGNLVVATDEGEWLSLGAGDELQPMTITGPMSDVVAQADGTVTVACWEPRLEQLRDGTWSTLQLGAPATALAATRLGLAIADTSGGLSLLRGTSRMPVQEMTTPEAILQLVTLGDGLAALGASGAVEVTLWPGGEAGLTPIHTGTIGRAHALFTGIREGTAIVAGARGIAVLEGGMRPRISAVTTDLGDRVCGAAVFANRSRALIYADNGDAWIVDEGLVRAHPLRLGSELVGAAPGGDGSVLAWTGDGALHVIGHDGANWKVTGGGVVLAVPEPARTGSIAIHWTASAGARVTRGHVAWN